MQILCNIFYEVHVRHKKKFVSSSFDLLSIFVNSKLLTANQINFAVAAESVQNRVNGTSYMWRAIAPGWRNQHVVPFPMTKWSRQNCRVQAGGDNGASNERNRRITPRTIIEFRRAVVTRRASPSPHSCIASRRPHAELRLKLENCSLNAYAILPRLGSAYSYKF